MSAAPLVCVGTSALVALVIEQPETPALLEWLDGARARRVSSELLETELRRTAVRDGRDQERISGFSKVLLRRLWTGRSIGRPDSCR